jgi:hypothetical protein
MDKSKLLFYCIALGAMKWPFILINYQ